MGWSGWWDGEGKCVVVDGGGMVCGACDGGGDIVGSSVRGNRREDGGYSQHFCGGQNWQV